MWPQSSTTNSFFNDIWWIWVMDRFKIVFRFSGVFTWGLVWLIFRLIVSDSAALLFALISFSFSSCRTFLTFFVLWWLEIFDMMIITFIFVLLSICTWIWLVVLGNYVTILIWSKWIKKIYILIRLGWRLLLSSSAYGKSISYLGVLLHMPFEVGFLPTRELTDLALMPFVVQMNCIDVVLEVMTLRHFYGTIWTLWFLDCL